MAIIVSIDLFFERHWGAWVPLPVYLRAIGAEELLLKSVAKPALCLSQAIRKHLPPKARHFQEVARSAALT